jgi:hypothetical protein
MNVVDMRDILTKTSPSLLRPNTAFIGNCNTSSNTFFTLHEIRSLPLGVLAARIRADLVAQTTRKQIDAGMRIGRASLLKSGYPPLYGEADMAFSAFSNWTKGNVFGVDFGAAVVGPGGGGASKGTNDGDGVKVVVARPSYVQTYARANGISMRNSGLCTGRDEGGNWWLASVMTPEAWERLDRAISETRF